MSGSRTHLIMLGDGRTSLKALWDDSVAGVEGFLAQQGGTENKSTWSLLRCTSQEALTVVHDRASIVGMMDDSGVPEQPGLITSFLAKIEDSVVREEERLAEMPEGERPEQIFLTVMDAHPSRRDVERDSTKIQVIASARWSEREQGYDWALPT